MKKDIKYYLLSIWYYFKCFIAFLIYLLPVVSLFISYVLWGEEMMPRDPRDIYINIDEDKRGYDDYDYMK